MDVSKVHTHCACADVTLCWKWRTWCRLFFVFHTGFLCLDLRTHKLQVTLSPVQQTIISVTYLIGLIQLLCSKVDLPRLPLLGKLLSEAPEMRQSFLCPLFARNKSSGCSQVCFFSSSLTLFLAMPGGCSPGIFQQQCFMYQYRFKIFFPELNYHLITWPVITRKRTTGMHYICMHRQPLWYVHSLLHKVVYTLGLITCLFCSTVH